MKRYPLLLRCAVITAVAVSILLPIALIKSRVEERKARAASVLAEFAHETSGSQVLTGPLLALTCEETQTDERVVMRAGKAETVQQRTVHACPTGYFAPRTLDASGHITFEERKRGIYPVRLYRPSLKLRGQFAWPRPPEAAGSNPRAWKSAYLVMVVKDPRGIREIRSMPAQTRVPDDVLDARFSFRASLGRYDTALQDVPLPFEIAIDMVGTSSLGIAPVGDATRIELTSDWPHPSFAGNWSPQERSISPKGFSARWNVSHHSTGGQVAWERAAREGKIFDTASVVSVTMVDPVNIYALSYRATEYAFLFVLFTFGALALAEALAGVRLHPVQYLLVGSAVAIFFLLLLALSEHLRFGASYGVAAAACIALLTFYLRHPLGTSRRAFAFLGFFSAMYGALYVLLRSEDHALLMGSLLVFALLAAAMIATRRIDWGALSARLAAQ